MASRCWSVFAAGLGSNLLAKRLEVIVITLVLSEVKGKRSLTDRYTLGHTRSRDDLRDGLSHLLGAAGSSGAAGDVRLDGGGDASSGLREAEVLEQQGARQDCRGRVGLVLP